MKKIVALALLVNLGVFTSCTPDEETTTTSAEVVAPDTYSFTRNGVSTVNFSGQIIRSKMADELFDALKGGTATAEELLSMYDHSANVENFSDAELNASSKQLKNKTAGSVDFYSTNIADIDAIKAKYEALINEQAANFSTWQTEASAGVAGYIYELDGTKRYFNENGVESNQFFAKALIGGLNVDQILNNYLSIDILDIGTNISDNDNGVLITGESYTTMEHKWDEAYGYLFGREDDPSTFTASTADQLLNNYMKKVDADEDFTGITQRIYDAFKLGRAAIVAKNYTLRDEQIDIIREGISEIVAIRTVYYLQQGKTKLSIDTADAFHDLSEGLGFVYSLMFTREDSSAEGSYFTFDEVDGYVTKIAETNNGLWQDEEVLSEVLDEISAEIAAKFSFTVAQARN